MKKDLLLLAVVVVVGLSASAALALAPIGQPTAGLKQGQWSAGFDYSYSTQGLKTTTLEGTCAKVGDPIVPTSTKLKFTKGLETQRYYGTIGYGIDDWWELNVSLGIADVKDTYKQVGTQRYRRAWYQPRQ